MNGDCGVLLTGIAAELHRLREDLGAVAATRTRRAVAVVLAGCAVMAVLLAAGIYNVHRHIATHTATLRALIVRETERDASLAALHEDMLAMRERHQELLARLAALDGKVALYQERQGRGR